MDLFDRLRAARPDDWRAYVAHPFVDGLGDGTLPAAAFQSYLVQDYLFLIQFARAYALAIYKSRTLDEMRTALSGVKAILDTEMDLHVRLCAGWGLGPSELERAPEGRATIAYTRFVLDCGQRGDLLDLYVALAPCVVGYAEIAGALARRPGGISESNPYRDWILEYSGPLYQEVARSARANLDRLARLALTEARFDDLAETFGRASRLEADFWSQGFDVLG
ncbi:TenA family protein [Prosthecomicrobium hirschii]|uniref:TenA family protein n=1 Tax=Prosthecodimorpha hirschii TaxID=665126 RepID=UPI00222032FB|nr:TenA family protein [Prosthecomicrobium hirschii]MCW1839876.1 TenA family protein [Prosthecomicrobium hirschii]